MAYINVDEVYILDNTGLQVDQTTDLPFKDAGLTESQQAQARKNIAAGGTNPNLLDNPFFTVRQRGDGPFSGAVFTADRWSIAGSTGSATLTSNGISVSLAAGAPILQRLGFELELGGPHTVSILEQGGTLSSATFTPTAGRENIVSVGEYLLDFDTRSAYAPYYRFMIYKNSAWTADFKAFKLEKGTVSTLANDVPPDYGTELLKCQYYFRRISASSINAIDIAFASSTTRADIINAGHSRPMRTIPTVTFSGAINVYNNGANHAVTAIAVVGYNTGFNLAFTTSGLSTGTGAVSFVSLNGTIDLSADL